MSRTRVKICGITRIADARAAEDAGCDAVGFVLWKGSPRYVDLKTVAAITGELSPMTAAVGVFVSPSAEEVLRCCRDGGLSGAQLCGDLADDDWPAVAQEIHVVRAIGVGPDSHTRFNELGTVMDILVDNHSDESPGGTGRTFNWTLVRGMNGCRRLWLAGGLNPSNVGDAIRQVRPFAVDVSSGVEEKLGLKSHKKIAGFISAVRTVDAELAQEAKAEDDC